MPTETNPTPRADNPTKAPEQRYFGIIAARRGTVPSGGGSVTVPAKVRFFYIKNAHASVPFALNFNGDSATEYWRLEPGEMTPKLQITEATVVNAQGIGGNSIYEAIFMG
jgi:hypothetical protein